MDPTSSRPPGVDVADNAAGDGTRIIDDDQEYREAVQWAQTGSRARATISSVTFGGKLGGDEVVWRMGIRVQPRESDPYETELAIASIAYFEDFPPWEVGNTSTIVFDPANPMVVRFLPPGVEPSVRWQVPATCPRCGAPVDQSTEALADHPTCRFCHEPLPCQPAV